MGYVLYDKMQVFPQFNSALIWLTKEEQSKFQYVKGDTEGFVNIPLSIKNIIFSVFLREDTEKKDVYKRQGHKEIAEMLGITEHTSSSQLYRAKTLLMKKINDYPFLFISLIT